MHASTAFLLAAASGLAAAQSSTTAPAGTTSSSTAVSGCGSQIDTIISSCLGTTQPQLQACATNDWDCMCEQTTNVLTCYNNCMSDPNRNGVLQQQTSYCNAAKAYGSSSSSVTGTVTGTATMATSGSSAMNTASASTTATATGTESEASGSSSASASGASASATDSGAGKVVPGALAAIFGLVALL